MFVAGKVRGGGGTPPTQCEKKKIFKIFLQEKGTTSENKTELLFLRVVSFFRKKIFKIFFF